MIMANEPLKDPNVKRIHLPQTPQQFLQQQRHNIEMVHKNHPSEKDIVITPVIGGKMPVSYEKAVIPAPAIVPVMENACNHIEVLCNLIDLLDRTLDVNIKVLEEEIRFLRNNKCHDTQALADMSLLCYKMKGQIKSVLTHNNPDSTGQTESLGETPYRPRP